MEAQKQRFVLLLLVTEGDLEKCALFLSKTDIQKRAIVLPFEEPSHSLEHLFCVLDKSKRHRNSIRKKLRLSEDSHFILFVTHVIHFVAQLRTLYQPMLGFVYSGWWKVFKAMPDMCQNHIRPFQEIFKRPILPFGALKKTFSKLSYWNIC